MEQRVFRTISDIFKVDSSEVNIDSSPEEIENWDSLGHMNLVLALEKEFDVSFSAQEIINMMNAKMILETISEKTGQANQTK